MKGLVAVVLAGGKQTRMGSDIHPKCLTPFRGDTILSHLLSQLGLFAEKTVLCIGHNGAVLREWAEKETHDINLVFSDAGAEASMMDRIQRAAHEHVAYDMLLCYGDTWANVPLMELWKKHSSGRAFVTATVMARHEEFGVIALDQKGAVLGYQEKPRMWASIGYQLWTKDAFKVWNPGMDLADMLSLHARMGTLGAYIHIGDHVTVNCPEDARRLEAKNA